MSEIPPGYTPEDWAEYNEDPCGWCIKELQNPDVGVRCTAADILRGLGPDAADAVPALIACFADSDVEVRRSCVFALVDIGYALTGKLSYVARAVTPLTRMLEDNDAECRSLAASALGAIGSSAESAVGSLLPLLSDADSDVRRASAQALGDIGAVTTVPQLRKLLADADREVSEIAAEAIAKLSR
jgi:HEAT repeat protein